MTYLWIIKDKYNSKCVIFDGDEWAFLQLVVQALWTIIYHLPAANTLTKNETWLKSNLTEEEITRTTLCNECQQIWGCYNVMICNFTKRYVVLMISPYTQYWINWQQCNCISRE